MNRRPNFLVIGAAKSGTTSLYYALRQHPDVFMPAVKEPRFFAYADAQPALRGPGDVRTHEEAGTVYTWGAYCDLFREATRESAVGEASPNYLYSAAAPRHIHARLPEVRLVALLRNPVDRAYSHFLHLVRSGREPLRDFGAALDAEAERIAQGWEWSWHYQQMGFYHRQLTRYLEYFPREQLAVYLFDDFVADPVAVVQQVYRHLGVDAQFTPDMAARHRATGMPRSERLQRLIHNADHGLRQLARYLLPEAVREWLLVRVKSANLEKPPLDPAVRARLTAVYRDDILQLQDLLDRDLTGWLESVSPVSST